MFWSGQALPLEQCAPEEKGKNCRELALRAWDEWGRGGCSSANKKKTSDKIPKFFFLWFSLGRHKRRTKARKKLTEKMVCEKSLSAFPWLIFEYAATIF